MLGYNGNGIRRSWRDDDWSEILKEQPDVVCFCEAKCPLWKLKRHANGTTWAYFREVYKYMFLFPANKPNDGTHGTYIFCKNQPDAWVRGMGGTEVDRDGNVLWDQEGRVCGAVFGKRVVLCTYATSPKLERSNLPLLQAFWKDYTTFIRGLIGKGYSIQGLT
jgi:exonuclease III